MLVFEKMLRDFSYERAYVDLDRQPLCSIKG